MDDFDFYEISAAEFAGESCDADCFFCISCTGGVWKECDVFRDVIEDVCEASFVCTAKCKGDDLCFCFLDAGFYEIE